MKSDPDRWYLCWKHWGVRRTVQANGSEDKVVIGNEGRNSMHQVVVCAGRREKSSKRRVFVSNDKSLFCQNYRRKRSEISEERMLTNHECPTISRFWASAQIYVYSQHANTLIYTQSKHERAANLNRLPATVSSLCSFLLSQRNSRWFCTCLSRKDFFEARK